MERKNQSDHFRFRRGRKLNREDGLELSKNYVCRAWLEIVPRDSDSFVEDRINHGGYLIGIYTTRGHVAATRIPFTMEWQTNEHHPVRGSVEVIKGNDKVLKLLAEYGLGPDLNKLPMQKDAHPRFW